MERDRKIDEIITHQKIHAKQAARSFNELFEKWNSILFYLSKDKNIVSMNGSFDIQLRELLNLFKNEIKGITRTDKTGKIIFTIPNIPGTVGSDISYQHHVTQILSSHKPVMSDVFDAVQGYKAIAIHYPVFKNGKFDGTIAFLLNFTQIAKKILDEIKIGRSGYAWIVSSKGNQLYSSLQVDSVLSKHGSQFQLPSYQKLINEMTEGKEGVEYYKLTDTYGNNVDRIAYFMPIKIKNTFWSIAVSYSEDELVSSIVNFRNKLIIILLVIFIGAISFSYFGLKAWLIVKESNARKLVENNLKESEQKFSQLIDGLPQLLWTATSEGYCDYLNNRWVEYTGIPEAEQLGDKWLKQIHPEDREKTINSWKDSVQSGSEFHIDYRIRRQDGIYRWFDTRALPLKDLNGKIVKWFGSNTDMQDEIDMREALKESEERYRSISSVTSDYMFSTTVEKNGTLKHNWVAGAFKTITGYDYDEFTARGGWRAALHPDDVEQDEEDMKSLFENKRVISEVRTITKDDKIAWVRVYALPVWDQKNNCLTGITGAVQDITARKQTEEELKKLYVATEQGPAAVVITNTQGEIEYVNVMFTKISGYTFREIKGKQLRILKHAKYNNENTDIWEAITGGNEWRGEYYNKRKDGTYYWESTLISPIKDEEGKITNFLAIQEDITEKKKTLQELITAKEKAEHANYVKNVFLANMSHELRTPLIGILGYSELLTAELGNENLEMARGINRSGNRLLKTLNMILDLAKVESEKFNLNLNVVDLSSEIELAFYTFKGAAQEKKIDFILNINSSGLFAKIDERIFRIIMENLINNAIKFTSEGSITISAGIENSNTVYTKVKDTGIGIAKENHEVIFEEFRQVSEGINREYQGTGLGLSITKKYVEILGGDISVESEFGVGSTFIIRFPLVKNLTLSS